MNQRIYENCTLADWDTPIDAIIVPPDASDRKKWGWMQDEAGQWYRELKPGQKFSEPAKAAE